MSPQSVLKCLLALVFALCASSALAQMPSPYGRPTKVWQDVVAAGGGGLRILRLEGIVPSEGGMPLVVDGKIVGAIGLSGGTAGRTASAPRRARTL